MTTQKLEYHRNRKLRAVNMARRCRANNNPAAEAQWLEVAKQESELIAAMLRHPAFRRFQPVQGPQPESSQT